MRSMRRKASRSDLVGVKSEMVVRESRNARMVCVFLGKKERGAARRLTLGEVARRCLFRRAEIRNKAKTKQSGQKESGAGDGENKDGGTSRRRFA